MCRDEGKRSENTDDAYQSNITSNQYRQLPKRKLKTRSKCCTASEINHNMRRDKLNQVPSKNKGFKEAILKNKLFYQYNLEEFICKFSFEVRLFTCSKVFILVTLFLVHNLSGVVGIRTAWVRQSLSSFDVEDEFHRFVEATGGNSEKFRFDGNFFSSPEKSESWDHPPDSLSFGKRLQSDTQEKQAPLVPEVVMPKILQLDEEIRVPRSFYADIFDSSLPMDSPHQKSLRTSRLPRPPQQSLPSFGDKMHFTVTKNPYLFSGAQQPISNDFSPTRVPQKTNRLKNFVFQSLGRQKFTSGEISEKRTITPNFTQKPQKKLNGRGWMKLHPKPRGMNNALVTNLHGSSGFVQHKPSVPIFTSTLYQRPGGVEPAMGTLSLGFPSSTENKGREDSGASTLASTVPVIKSSGNRAKSGRPTGCIDEEGKFRRQRERWFGQNCTRHTCVVFRSRHFVETDSCESEIRNTSYRCFMVANERASYPHCCPKYTCHPDNLGTPIDSSET